MILRITLAVLYLGLFVPSMTTFGLALRPRQKVEMITMTKGMELQMLPESDPVTLKTWQTTGKIYVWDVHKNQLYSTTPLKYPDEFNIEGYNCNVTYTMPTSTYGCV